MDKPDRQAHRQFMKDHVDSWQNTNLTQKEYCSQNNLNYHTFNIWVKKFNAGSRHRKRSFVALRIKNNGQEEKGNIFIRYPSGVQLTIPAAMSTQRVIELIRLF